MNTTQLECFLAVAETLNFSKAAEMVNISQPAVSHQISSLEAELGVRLFLRTNKSVQLTKEGLIFIGDAETIVRTAMNSIHRLSTNVKEKKRTVAIGVHNQYELDAAVPVMNIIGKMYPNFEPEITMMPFKSLDNLLEENKLQIIFAIKSENETAKAECFTALCEWPVMLICRKAVSYTHLRAHETGRNLVCRLLLEKKKKKNRKTKHCTLDKQTHHENR